MWHDNYSRDLMKKILSSHAVTQSGHADPNTDTGSFLIALFLSLVHLLCLLLFLLLLFVLFFWKVNTLKNMLVSYVHLKKNFRGPRAMSERALSLIVFKILNLRLAVNEESLVHERSKQLFFVFLHLFLKLCVKR